MKNTFDNILKDILEKRETTLPAGHVGRFGRKLADRSRQRMVRRRIWVVSVASAAVLVLLVLAARFRDTVPPFGNSDGVEEVFAYYDSRLNVEIEQIRDIVSHSGSGHRQLLADLERMRKEPAGWRENLALLTADDRIAVIVNRYDVQLGILGNIKNLLQKQVSEETRDQNSNPFRP